MKDEKDAAWLPLFSEMVAYYLLPHHRGGLVPPQTAVKEIPDTEDDISEPEAMIPKPLSPPAESHPFPIAQRQRRFSIKWPKGLFRSGTVKDPDNDRSRVEQAQRAALERNFEEDEAYQREIGSGLSAHQSRVSRIAKRHCESYRDELYWESNLSTKLNIERAEQQDKERIAACKMPKCFKDKIYQILKFASNEFKLQIDTIPKSQMNCNLSYEETETLQLAKISIEKNGEEYRQKFVKFDVYYLGEVKYVCKL